MSPTQSTRITIRQKLIIGTWTSSEKYGHYESNSIVVEILIYDLRGSEYNFTTPQIRMT